MRGVIASLLMLASCGASSDALHVPDHLPIGRGYHGAVRVGERVVLVGGSSPDGNIPQVDLFDVRGGSWSTAAPLPTTRDFAGVAALEDQVYVAGGLHLGREPVATVERLDLSDDRWEALPDLPCIRHRFQMVALEGKVYALGGFGIRDDGEHANVDRVDVFDPRTNSWSRVRDMAVPRHGHAAVVHDGRIVVAGGYGGVGDAHGVLDSVEVYDPGADTWSAGPDLNTARGFLGLTTCGGRVWAVGGRIDGCPTESWSFGEDAWRAEAPLDVTLQRFAMVGIGDCVVTLGCEDHMSAVHVFDTSAREWRTRSSGE